MFRKPLQNPAHVMRQVGQRLEVVALVARRVIRYLGEHRISEIEHGGVKRSRHADS